LTKGFLADLYPTPTREITNAVNFSGLLCLGWKAKRKEQSAKRKTKEFSSHEFFLVAFADT
jgi:hypothetical protein